MGVTFPFNIRLGIPLYTFVAKLTYGVRGCLHPQI